MSRPLRYYQSEATSSVFSEWGRVRSTLLVMATATGKTRTFSEVIADVQRDTGGRALVLAHRGDLVRQLAREISINVALPTEIEMAELRADGSMFAAPVVVASVQSLCQPHRLARYQRDAFAVIVVDEAHHAVSSSYRAIVDYFASAKVLGVTATPDRGDKRALGIVFDSVAYEYPIRRGIADGFLVPIRQEVVSIDGLDAIASMKVAGDDLDDEELAKLMESEAVLHAVATPTIERMGERPTVVFGASVAQARALAAIFNRHSTGCAIALWGESTSEEREAGFRSFIEGRIRFLVNCNLITEGVDLPPIAGVAMARPTRSRALYTQVVGRGLRLSPGKADCLVLDFVGASKDLKLVSSIDILGGDYTDKVREVAKRLAREEGGEVDQLLGKALEAERARELGLIAAAKFRTEVTDPFAVAPSAAPERHAPASVTRQAAQAASILGVELVALEGPPPNFGQLGTLQRADIETMGLTAPMAARLVSALERRRQKGLCTYKQARTLARAKENPNATFDEARRLIDALAANRWRPLSSEQRASALGLAREEA